MKETKIQPEKLDLTITLSVPINQSYECFVTLDQLEEIVRHYCVSEDRFALVGRIKRAKEIRRLDKEIAKLREGNR